MTQVHDIFPTPVMHVPHLLPSHVIEAACKDARESQRKANTKSKRLTHTEIVSPKENGTFLAIGRLALPKVIEYGTLLFGETLRWGITGMWVNVLEKGGHQALHTHANSFVSGVVFLTGMHPSANTIFHRPMGNGEFNFANNHDGVKHGAYNSQQWVSPDPDPGDLILFPSYLLHAVPRNEGEQRISIAFNAIPDRLDSWGYKIQFS